MFIAGFAAWKYLGLYAVDASRSNCYGRNLE